MSDKSLSQRWEAYHPSKALWLWSCIGAIVLTMIVGFTVGGWVTGGTAGTMAADAARDARLQVVSALCVNKFVSADNAAARLAKLKDASTWDRDDMIEDGGWTTIAGLTEETNGAADACAEQLTAMDQLPAKVTPAAATSVKSTVDG